MPYTSTQKDCSMFISFTYLRQDKTHTLSSVTNGLKNEDSNADKLIGWELGTDFNLNKKLKTEEIVN